jgi:hypothetical protein
MMQASSRVHENFMVGLLFDPEDGYDMFLRNVSLLSPDFTALFLRKKKFVVASKKKKFNLCNNTEIFLMVAFDPIIVILSGFFNIMGLSKFISVKIFAL